MADLEAEAAAHVTSDACTPARRPPTRTFTADSDRASRSARHARAQRVSASDFEARDFQSRPVDRVVPSDDMTDAEMADAPPPAAAEGAAAADAAETQIAIGATDSAGHGNIEAAAGGIDIKSGSVPLLAQLSQLKARANELTRDLVLGSLDELPYVWKELAEELELINPCNNPDMSDLEVSNIYTSHHHICIINSGCMFHLM